MCGRFSLIGNLMWLIRLLNLEPLPVFADRFNIGPGQPLLTFLYDIDRGGFRHDFLYWGFLPAFAKDPSQLSNLINARAESVAQKVAFKNAFKYRRCVIPASGFYEWHRNGSENMPWYFSDPAAPHLLLAGIWEIWHGDGGEQVNSCAILTRPADSVVSRVHHRMPVIITQENLHSWLEPQTEFKVLMKILRECPQNTLQCWSVSPRVNSVRHDSPECIKPYGIRQPGLFDISP